MSETSTMGAEAPQYPGVVETGGATVEAAITAALEQLGIQRDDAEVDIVSRGMQAVPGESVSGGEARVRVRQLDAHTRRGRTLLAELLRRMDIPATISVRRAPATLQTEGDPPVILDVSGEDLGLLIGWRGEMLRSLQTVLNLMLGDDDHEGRRLIIDVERYRARREEQVRELAVRIAHRVKRTGERYAMDPMHPYERRAVHVALGEDEGVRTESIGKDLDRRIVVHPTGPPRTDLLDERPRRGDDRSPIHRPSQR